MYRLTNYSQLNKDPFPGLPKGYWSPDYELASPVETMFNFDGNGRYSKPGFTRNFPVGLTSVKFFDSHLLGKEYKNDMFVGMWDNQVFYIILI